MKRYTLSELKALPTISTGATDDLKVAEPGLKVWLSRLTKADGVSYDNEVAVEKLVNGSWQTVLTYQALDDLSVFDKFGGYYSIMLDNIEFARFAPSLVWSDMAKVMEDKYGKSFSYKFIVTD